MADFTFRVKPEELERKAGEFKGIIQSIQRHLSAIEDISGKTRRYWIGEAGDQSRSGYSSYQEDIGFIIKRLKEHPDDLLKMAGIYRQAEQKAQTISNTLKVD